MIVMNITFSTGGIYMRLVLPFILISFLFSCANHQQVLNSNFSTVKSKNTGVLLTVDLNTAGKIKRGKMCNLIINQGKTLYRVPLKEGAFNYALPLNQGVAKIQELTCGPFYYYKIKENGANFQVSNGQISYLGTLDFELEEKGRMTWGPSTKSRRLLEGHLGEMGLTSEDVVIKPLKL